MHITKILLILLITSFCIGAQSQITIWRIDEEHKHSNNHMSEEESLGEEPALYPCGTSYYSELHDGESSHTSIWSVKNEGSSTISITEPISLSGGIGRFTLEANDEAIELRPGEEFHFKVTYNGLSGSEAQVDIQSTIGSCSLIVDGGTAVSVCDISWSGPTTGSWEVGANWDLNRVPTDGDLVCVFNANVTISSAALADAVWVEDGSLTIAANHSLTLDGTSIWTGGSSLANGLNIVSSTYTNNGSQIINNVPGNGIYLENSTFINSSGASIGISSPDSEGIELDNGVSTFTNNGTINISDANADGIDLDGSSFSFTNNGSITIDNSGAEGIDLESSQSSTAVNNGSITITNTDDEGIEVQDENIFVNTGQLSFSGTDDDDIDVEDDGAFRNSGNITMNSTTASDAIELSGNTLFTNERCGVINILIEKIDLSGNSALVNDGIIAINEENNENDGSVTNNGRFITPSGSISFSPNPMVNNGTIVSGVIPTNDSLCNESIPTLSQWAVILLLISVLIVGVIGIRETMIGSFYKK